MGKDDLETQPLSERLAAEKAKLDNWDKWDTLRWWLKYRLLRRYLNPKWLATEWPSDCYYTVKHRIQRAKRGYSDSDIWSFDYHLACMLVDALPRFKNSDPHNHALFVLKEDEDMNWNYNNYSEEEQQAAKDRWDAKIDETVLALKDSYSEDGDAWAILEGNQRVTDAMHFVAEYFQHLWI